MKYLTREISIAALYILDEGHDAPKAKMGTSYGKLWERLRVLNQGNWRDLKFSALYYGPGDLIEKFEETFKKSNTALGGGGRTEWFNHTPKELEHIIDNLVQAPIFKLTGLVPYQARKGSMCTIKSYNDMYQQLIKDNNFDFLTYYSTSRSRYNIYSGDYGMPSKDIIAEGRDFKFV
jgi:hypothetical protein